jgi:predicted amidohydrolase YtcJ
VGLFGVAQAQDIAIANATVYTSPGAAAQPHTTDPIQGGKIVAVGNGVSVLSSVQTLSCRGCVVFAGFWNTHVHFTGPQRNEASKIPANTLTQQMQAMLGLRFQRIQARSELATMEILRSCLQIRLRASCRISAVSHMLSVPDV